MMSPWVILGIALFWGASVTGAYFKGQSVAENAARAEYAIELEDGIARFNVQAMADQEQAVKAAQRTAAAKARASTIRSQSNAAIQAKPLPVICDWSDDAYKLLVAATKAASGDDPATAAGLSSAVSRANAASKPQR